MSQQGAIDRLIERENHWSRKEHLGNALTKIRSMWDIIEHRDVPHKRTVIREFRLKPEAYAKILNERRHGGHAEQVRIVQRHGQESG